MDITHLDIDKLISARAKTQTEELPIKIKRLEFMRKQKLTYDYFSDWAGHLFTMIGLRLKAEDKAVIKRNTFKDLLYQSSWKQWNNIRQCKKHYGKITTTFNMTVSLSGTLVIPQHTAWAPASAGMTDRDLAWSRFRRNLDHITIKGYWVLNLAIQFLLIAIGFFLGSNSFPNLNAGNVPLSSFLTGPRV
jgi:hypothetical protein